MREIVKEKLYGLEDYSSDFIDDVMYEIAYLNRFGECYFEDVDENQKKEISRIVTMLIDNYAYLCTDLRKNYYMSKRFQILYKAIYSKFDIFRAFYNGYCEAVEDYVYELKTVGNSIVNWRKFKLKDIADFLESFYLLFICIDQDLRAYDFHMLNKGNYVDDGPDISTVRSEKKSKLMKVRTDNRRLGLE